MKLLQDITNLISVRNFLVSSVDNMSIKLSREQVKKIQDTTKVFDQKIIDAALSLNVDDLGKGQKQVLFTRESTEDTETVMNKFMAAESTVAPQAETPTPTDSRPSSTESKLAAISHSKSKAAKPTFKRTDSEE
jgi:hypothetical protein